MKQNNRNPSEVNDAYWILAFNEKDNYKIKRGNSGKWLVFEHISEIDNLWLKIREATVNGQLGGSSKTSTAKPNPNASDNDYKVICVYTADFSNKEDVKRIEYELRKIGVENKLIYKLDRDVGKYQNKGDKNLSQEISYSQRYFEALKWLEANPKNKYIRFIGKNLIGKKRYRFQRLDISKEEFEAKRIVLSRIGFNIEKQNEIKGEELFFSE